MQGPQVKTVEQLATLAENRRSVYVPKAYCFATPKPASVILHMHATDVLRLIRKGMYVYIKPRKK